MCIVGNLDPHIPFDVVKEPSNFADRVIIYPSVILKLVVPLLFEEKDLVWAPGN